MPQPPATESWHLDKKVPIAIIGSIILQTGAIVWWGSKLDHRVEVAEQRLIELRSSNQLQDSRVDNIETDRRINLQRLSRVEQAMTDIREIMGKIDAKLDRLSERR